MWRAHVAADLRVLARLGDRLHPEARQQRPSSRASSPARSRASPRPRPRCSISASIRVADPAPRLVEARDVEVALRREVPVQDRLRDAGLARDLRRRRARVAPLREDAQRRLDDAPAGARRRQGGLAARSRDRLDRRARPAPPAPSCGRTSTNATIAPAAAIAGGDEERALEAVDERLGRPPAAGLVRP